MSKPLIGTRDQRLMCNVVSLAYDFSSHSGQLYLTDGNCCDMIGCVTLFEGIDPNVTVIKTYSGDKADTIYRKEDTEWHSFLPCEA